MNVEDERQVNDFKLKCCDAKTSLALSTYVGR